MNRIALKTTSTCNVENSKPASLPRRISNMVCGIALAMVVAGPAMAGPTGGEVVAGDGTITSDFNLTQINQNSNRIAINWETFNVAANETVRFVQPSSTSVALNTIFDQNASQIFGTIDANGRVLLINPNGMIFGPTAQVNVAGLVASSLNISTTDFMAGNYTFDSATGSAGMVLNQGSLQAAPGGFIALLGEAVANEGLIVADAGTIAMGAGTKVALDFDGSGLIFFEVESEILDAALGADAAVSNSGSLFADGGQVLLTARAAQDVYTRAINNEGLIQARRIDNQGGVIRLTGGSGTVVNTGAIDATGGDAQSTGGDVELLGNRVGLLGSGSIDVSGDAGGGTVHLGGAAHGAGDLTAEFTQVSADASISADAGVSGDGGEIIVWADDSTWFFGSASVTGGSEAGDGGFVEISGAQGLSFAGTVDATAANGSMGTLLFDPTNITIIDGAGPGADDGPPFPDLDNDPATVGDFEISQAALETQAATANIDLVATNDITIDNLTNDVLSLPRPGGSVSFAADSDSDGAGAFSMDASDTIDTNGGSLTISGAVVTVGDVDTTGADDFAGGTVDLEATDGALVVGTITTDGGADVGDTQGYDAGDVLLAGSTSVSVGNISAQGSAATTVTNPNGSDGAVTMTSTGAVTMGSVAADSLAATTAGTVTVGGSVTTAGAAGIALQGGTVVLADAITLTSNDQSISIIADLLTDGATTAIDAGTGTVTLAPLDGTNTVGICDENATNGCGGAPSDTEYDLASYSITASTLQVGATGLSGNISLAAATLGGVGQAYDLALQNEGTGAVSVDGAFSGQGLDIDSGSGGIALNDNVTTNGGNAVFADAVSVGGNVTTGGGNVEFSDTVSLGGDVTTGGGDAVFTGAVDLTADASVNTTGVTDGSANFQAEITGNQGLDVNAGTGTVSLADVGQGGAGNVLTDLAVTGGTINLGGDITTSGAAGIVLSGTKNLTADVTLTTSDDLVDLDTGAIVSDDGTQGLAIAAGTGTVSLADVGQGGAANSLTDLAVSGGTINLGGDITTSGAAGIVLSGTKNLTADVTLTTSDDLVDLDTGAIVSDDGTQGLAIAAGTGTVSLADVGQGGAANSLTDLAVTGGTINLGGDITTSGAAGIVLSGTKILTADVTLTTSNDLVDLDTGAIEGGQALDIDAGTGTVSLGDVGQVTALTALTVTSAGDLNLNGDVITAVAGGGMDFDADTVSLAANVDLVSNDADITFATDTLNTGANSSINAGTGTVALAPGDVASTIEVCDGASCAGGLDAQYDVGGLATVTAGQFQIGRALHTGDITLNQAAPTFNLSLENGGTGSITVAGDFSGNGLALNSGSGGINLDANVTTSGDDVLFSDDVTLGAAATSINTGAGAGSVVFQGDIDGASALTVAAGTGSVSLGDVGQATGEALSSLDVSGANVGLGGDITTNGDVSIAGATNLTASVTIDSSAGDGAIDLSAAPVTDTGSQDLVLESGAGQIDLAAVSTDTLSAATTGNMNLGGDVTTVGAGGIALQGDAVALADGVDLVSNNQSITIIADTLTDGATSTINAGNGTLTLAPLTASNTVDICNVDAANGCSVAPPGTATEYDLASLGITAGNLQVGQDSQTGDIVMGTAVLGAGQTYAVSLQNGGTGGITIAGEFSGNGLTVNSGSDGIALNGNVTTTGDNVVFNDDVTLGVGAPTINTGAGGGNVDFQGTVNGTSALTVAAGTGSVSVGDVGTGTALSSLDVSGASVDLGGDITTGGNVTISGATNLSANVVIDSSAGDGAVNISTGNLTNSADENLTINSGAGAVTLADVNVNTLNVTTSGAAAVGAVTNTGDIDISAGSIAANGAMTGDNISLAAASAAVVLPQVTAANSLSVQAGGDISATGSIQAGGDASFDSTGAITLDQANSTYGSLSLIGTSAVVNEEDATELAAANITGDLTLTSGGNITDSGTVIVGGAATLTADGGAADITLADGASTFGSLVLTATNASIVEADSTDLGASSIASDLTVNSGGDITDSGTLTVGGVATLDAAGDIALDEALSTFGSMSIAGNSVSITENDSMTITDITASSLTTNSSGGQTITGSVGTFNATNTASGDISLANTGDLTITGISQTGGAVTVGTDGSLDQSADITSSGGEISLTADGAITMAEGAVTSSNGGDINYTSTGSGSDITINRLDACVADACDASDGSIVVDSGGSIFGVADQDHITAQSAYLKASLLDPVGDIGQDSPDGSLSIAFVGMDENGNAEDSGDPILLEFGGSAFIDEGLFNFSVSDSSNAANVAARGQANASVAASAQAAALEEGEDVDWAAFSEEVTVYEINNDGVQLPQDQQTDEFAKLLEEALRKLSEDEIVSDANTIFDIASDPKGIPVSQLTKTD